MFFIRKKKPYPEREYPIMQQPALEPNRYQRAQMERRFGMFIHFGINTFYNTEWSNGRLPIRDYCPTAIDADSWVRTAYEAGMNYVILITKHHDGFCLWDTRTTSYSVRYSPNPTDVVRAVSEACRKYGIRLGLYYSLWDRHKRCYRNREKYVCYMERQLAELLDGRYGEIVELWLDGAWNKPCRAWRLDRLYDHVKRLQPACQIGVNHTVGEYLEKKGGPDPRYQPQNCRERDPLRMFPSDFRLWDPYMCREDDPKIYTFNGKEYYLPFEMTICSRKEFSWLYSDTYERKPLMDAEEIVRNYRILEKAGNMMVINLPPDLNGKLVPGDVENLMHVSEALGLRRSDIRKESPEEGDFPMAY